MVFVTLTQHERQRYQKTKTSNQIISCMMMYRSKHSNYFHCVT